MRLLNAHGCTSATRVGLRILLCFLVSACGTLPPKSLLAPFEAVVGLQDTALASMAALSIPAGSASGFRMLGQPREARQARTQLIQRAEKAIVAQYYHVGNDLAGHTFLASLSAAASRGVKVRLLVDDLFTSGLDPALRALATQPNMEVRLFNPFCCARSGLASRFLASALDVRRLNHRMHNKLLVADGVMAITGGRNIGDEYFDLGSPNEFIDLDVLMVGEISSQLSAIFERYWESRPVWPALAILPPQAIESESAEFPDGMPAPKAPFTLLEEPPDRGLTALETEMSAGVVKLAAGSAFAFADAPDKGEINDEEYMSQSTVIARVRDLVLSAREEVVISSPYLIPRETGLHNIRHMARNDVRVVILTNSMAANDSAFAHAGYARYRRDILAAGAELFEISPGKSGKPRREIARKLYPASLGRLHTKTVVIDRQWVFIGSLNLDPRSAEKNTELGIWIESPVLAADVLGLLDLIRLTGSYSVQVDPESGRLKWMAFTEGELSILDAEPESSPWMRLLNLLVAPLVPESLL